VRVVIGLPPQVVLALLYQSIVEELWRSLRGIVEIIGRNNSFSALEATKKRVQSAEKDFENIDCQTREPLNLSRLAEYENNRL